jgi:hypothetical protein
MGDDSEKNECARSQREGELDIPDLWLVFVITFFGFQSRIWAIHQPQIATLEEQYYGPFLNAFLKSEFFVYGHPPLSMLIAGAYASACEYKGDIAFARHALRPYQNKIYTSLRFIGACMAGFVPVISFLTMRFFGVTRYGSLTCAVMIFCETSLISEARVIGGEGPFQFFFTVVILSLVLNYGLPFLSVKWICAVAFVGFSFGCLISTQFTGFALIPLIVAFQYCTAKKQLKIEKLPCICPLDLRQVWMQTGKITLPILAIAVAVYYFFVVLFISQLPYESSGGVEWPDFRKLLLNRFLVGAGEGNFSQRMYGEFMLFTVLKFTRATLKSQTLQRNASFAAHLFQFPIGRAPVFVKWIENSVIFASHINWFNAVLGSASVVSSGLLWLFRARLGVKFQRRFLKVLPCILGFLGSFAMLAFRKPLFVNDYAMPLMLAVYVYCAGLHFLLKDFGFFQGLALSLSQFAPMFGFILWCPWAYGLPGGRIETRTWSDAWFPAGLLTWGEL